MTSEDLEKNLKVEVFMNSDESTINELLELTQQLLDAIAEGDWDTYATLCDPSISAFEPEAHGHLVEGMDFHQFFFEHGGKPAPHNTTISSPHVRLLGDTAVVSYVRLVQRLDGAGHAVIGQSQETRVWSRQSGAWRHVHFHRSISA